MDQNTLTLEVSFSKKNKRKDEICFFLAPFRTTTVCSQQTARDVSPVSLRDISIRALTWKEAKVGKLQLALSTY